MARALEIKRIDLIVHPFYDPREQQGQPPIPYGGEKAQFLLKEWKGQIDEAARDPNRLLLLSPAPKQAGWQSQMSEMLVIYAGKKLGERFGFFMKPGKRISFHDKTGYAFRNLKKFLKAKDMTLNPEKVKTRSLGEYTNSCVVKYLFELNKRVGLPNPIPYRNRQSTVLARKSVGADLRPWELKGLMGTPKGRVKLKSKAKKYAWRRLESANILRYKLTGEKNFYKPRTHLMKKRKP